MPSKLHPPSSTFNYRLLCDETVFRHTPWVSKQEKPTNCGTRAVDVLANFWPVNFNANQLNILVQLPLL